MHVPDEGHAAGLQRLCRGLDIVGIEVQVEVVALVDELDGELAIARSMADAPEIDGVVQIQDGRDAGLQVGEFVDVRIMGSDEHDLYGEVEYAGAMDDAMPLGLRLV